MTAFYLLLLGCAHADMSRQPNAETTHKYFIDDDVECHSSTNEVSPQQQSVVEDLMTVHAERLNHLLWHSTRNGWDSLTDNEKTAVKKVSPQWGLNKPLCDGEKALMDNGSGEEFLYMHHGMVTHVKQALINHKPNSLPCIAAWERPPKANDRLWPVPKGDADDSSKGAAMAKLMDAWSDAFSDEKKPNGFLATHSLSEIGYMIEFSIHNNMHMRWSTIPNKGDDYSPLSNNSTSIKLLAPSPEYDTPSRNWLGNPFNAHVNKTFWKLHGWVDGVIEKWLRAHDKTEISAHCNGRVGCYEWRSLWVGGGHPPAGMKGMPMAASAMSAQDQARANSAIQKIFGQGSFRNSKFDEFLAPKRSKSPGSPQPATPPPSTHDLGNPEKFTAKFGPCVK